MTAGSSADRRHFLQAAGLGAAGVAVTGFPVANAAQIGAGANAQSLASPTMGRLRQVRADELDVAYAEMGPAEGPVAILLHGWPYDIHCYEEVAPLLAKAGYRVIVPYLRGYGPTRFILADAVRNGQQAVARARCHRLDGCAQDRDPTLGGCDWGARTACIVAAIWPERCTALVSVSGYLIGSQEAGAMPLQPKAERSWWYQFYFATDRGQRGYDANRAEFAKLIWRSASPEWRFDDATFARSAQAFDNPDHVAIVIHNYRWRLGLADGDPRLDALDNDDQACDRQCGQQLGSSRAHASISHPRRSGQRTLLINECGAAAAMAFAVSRRACASAASPNASSAAMTAAQIGSSSFVVMRPVTCRHHVPKF